MTEEEITELLKEVARVAPEGCTCYFSPAEEAGTDSVYFADWDESLRLDGEIYDAVACFAMLDAMEKKGLEVQIIGNPNYYVVKVWAGLSDQTFDGNTRVFAVARAFVKVFGTP